MQLKLKTFVVSSSLLEKPKSLFLKYNTTKNVAIRFDLQKAWFIIYSNTAFPIHDLVSKTSMMHCLQPMCLQFAILLIWLWRTDV